MSIKTISIEIMNHDEELAGILRKLTQEFDSIVFWKHLDRGLSHSGDIDTIAPPSVASRICNRFAELACETWDDLRIIFCCRHAQNVFPVFLVRQSTFPLLAQFDVTFRTSRMGTPWLDPSRLPEFSMINNLGIRVLRPGPLAVVLSTLYGIQVNGRLSLKNHDLNDVYIGFRRFSEDACDFTKVLLPSGLKSTFSRLIPEAQKSESHFRNEFASWSKIAFRACLTDSIKYQCANFGFKLPSLLRKKYFSYCDVRHIVHECSRVVPRRNLEEFIAEIVQSEDILFNKESR